MVKDYKVYQFDGKYICKNCGKELVRFNDKWKHKGFEDILFICGNPQSKIRYKDIKKETKKEEKWYIQ